MEELQKARGDEEYVPELPPLDEGGEYLISYLWEIGPVMAGAMSVVPITQAEIRAWQDNMHVKLTPGEVQMLRNLSIEFVAEAGRATDRMRPAPWQPEDTGAEDRRRVRNSMKSAMRDLARF